MQASDKLAYSPGAPWEAMRALVGIAGCRQPTAHCLQHRPSQWAMQAFEHTALNGQLICKSIAM